MRSPRSGNGKAAFWGALGGLLVGVGVGLLVAPEQGQRVRRRLAFQLDRLASRLNALLEPAPGMENEARRSGRSLVQGARAQAHEIMHEVDALIDEVRRGSSP